MHLRIEPFTAERIPAVEEFNLRLQSGGKRDKFQTDVAYWLPKLPGRKIFQEFYLVVEDGFIRGGYILKHQRFYFKNRMITIGNYQLPVSEGIVNRDYNLVALLILRDALKKQPYLFGLGMGSLDAPIAQIFKSMKWSFYVVPFYAKVLHPFNFFRHIAYLRKTRARRALLNMLAYTGIGAIAVKLFQNLLQARYAREEFSAEATEINEFGPWADELWNSCKGQYSMIAERDAETNNILYPSRLEKFIRLKITRGGKPLGWVVLLDTQMQNPINNSEISALVH